MVDIGNMMKQAQQLQKKMSEAQEKLNSIEVEGTSGGGLVKVVATAKGEFKRLLIDETLMKPDEKRLIKGIIINKFRGDKTLFERGSTTAQSKIRPSWTNERLPKWKRDEI